MPAEFTIRAPLCTPQFEGRANITTPSFWTIRLISVGSEPARAIVNVVVYAPVTGVVPVQHRAAVAPVPEPDTDRTQTPEIEFDLAGATPGNLPYSITVTPAADGNVSVRSSNLLVAEV